MPDYDVIVVGGGTVGMSIAYGLERLGKKTAVFDQGDDAIRAAVGNFGLVWVQGKGIGSPEYADWTRRSAELWEQYGKELQEQSGIDIAYSRSGGFHFCLSDEELESRTSQMSQLAEESEGDFSYEMLDRHSLLERLPAIGPEVKGASYSPLDGHVNPLLLLRALHVAFKSKGGDLLVESVLDITFDDSVFTVSSTSYVKTATQVVLAAGLGSEKLAPKLGLTTPLYPQRGQILVTEKTAPFLDYPTSLIRQTGDGSVLLGDSHEDVGFDTGTSSGVMHDIAQRACDIFPYLEKLRIVRAWGALRIMSPDGLPIYDQSTQYPGAFTATCHSGVTLSAAHALDFASFIREGELPFSLEKFSERRFYVH
ncbi:NAD(P)/FAD-dependent oxidoreductase [Marinomonas transparens]|uniref:FAD-binding oxidoreductase n=1 Tax=Marinomonas transparens TaxID=2795388 RepID=A0A934MW09_9GAMM|nr:FAD-dependent oxidoreductase [Marinomonas transparens]MBJ7537654.1 FAD-binding oxidoreductase [Marinomonas transparens]